MNNGSALLELRLLLNDELSELELAEDLELLELQLL